MRITRAAFAFIVAAVAASACADSTGPAGTEHPLAGLLASSPQDSAGTPITPPGGVSDSGYFHGFVRAQNEPGAGGDTLANAPRIAGVVVSAYPILAPGAAPTLGPLAAQVTTNAQGAFTLPKLAGGEYAVTFRPPAGSGYYGIWASGPIHATSADFAWWVTLPRI